MLSEWKSVSKHWGSVSRFSAISRWSNWISGYGKLKWFFPHVQIFHISTQNGPEIQCNISWALFAHQAYPPPLGVLGGMKSGEICWDKLKMTAGKYTRRTIKFNIHPTEGTFRFYGVLLKEKKQGGKYDNLISNCNLDLLHKGKILKEISHKRPSHARKKAFLAHKEKITK